jgi:DNA invertase Pin-like site-specific DNA recombinase/predicted metal-binding protein
MKIIAYLYSDPLLEPAPDPNSWGWEVDRVYQDLADRTELKQLMADCEAEPANYLLIRRLEELGDSVIEISDRLTQLETLGTEIVAVETAGSISEHSASSVKRSDLMQLLAEIQATQRSRKIRQGHARNRINALPPPGKAPYGYRRGKDRYALDRAAAPVIKDFFEHFLLYGSLRGAVRYLAQKYGKKISVTTGRRWLTNPAYRGDLAYKNGEVISNTHIPIISREEAAQVDRLLRRNQRMPPRTASSPRSLSGLVICGQCQSTMTVTRVTTYRGDREYLYLRPSNCPQQPKCSAIAYAEVLEKTIERICQDLPAAVANLQTQGKDTAGPGSIKQNMTEAIAHKQQILDRLPQLCQQDILDPETSQLRAYKLRSEISQLQNQLAQFPPVNLLETAQAVSLPQFWLDLSESERRFYFREFIRQIQIDRNNRSSWQLQVLFIFESASRNPGS